MALTDDGEEGSVDYGVVDVLKEDGVGGSGKDGLGSLDNLAKGDGTGTKSEHGEGMGERGPETDGEKLLPVGL